VTDQLKKLLNSIDIEIQATKNKVIHDAMSSNELTNHLSKNLEKDTIKNLLESICKFYPYENIDFVHNLSDDNYYSLRNKLSNLLNFSRKQLHNKTKKLNHLEMHLKTLTIESKELNAAKSSGQLDILLTYQSENIDLINNLKINTEKIKEQEIIIDITNKELSVIENQLWNQLKKNNVNNVLDKIHTVLDQYIIRVKKQKITEIEDYTKYMFNLLIRKNNFIKDFKIQDKTIYLLDHNGNKLSHLNLSAGEKQLFVLSMIYAIIKSSERTVPLIFDTLFGRLDEEHRNNVFKAFIKSCPDQVIILATDSEIANIDKESLSSITNKECTIDLSKSEKQMPLLEA
jgi:DNA sulfur modification protein DndD